MKKKILSTVACIFIFSLVTISCNQKVEKPSPATPEELSQMNKDFAKAVNAKDAATAANLYMPDGKLLPPNETVVTGRDNIQKYWQASIDSGVSDVSVSTIATGSDGDLGYEEGRFQLSIHHSDGTISIDRGKYLELLKRDTDGKWRSIYGMWNADSSEAAN